MTTKLDQAIDAFLSAETVNKQSPTPQTEAHYAKCKYALYVIAKETQEALRYYAMGGNDNGRTANLGLYGQAQPKECKSC